MGPPRELRATVARPRALGGDGAPGFRACATDHRLAIRCQRNGDLER